VALERVDGVATSFSFARVRGLAELAQSFQSAVELTIV
jgi:hypothetical protein